MHMVEKSVQRQDRKAASAPSLQNCNGVCKGTLVHRSQSVTVFERADGPLFKVTSTLVATFCSTAVSIDHLMSINVAYMHKI